MKSKGMTENEIQGHFKDWSKEDTYFSLTEETLRVNIRRLSTS